MKPIRRRIWKLIPTAFCVAVVALWLADRYQPRALLVRTFGGHALAIAGGRSGVLIAEGKANFEGVVTTSGELESFAVVSVTENDLGAVVNALLDQSTSKIGRGGVLAAIGPKAAASFAGIDSFAMITLPYWLLLLFAAPGVAMPLRRRLIRWRRKRKGLCEACGYDLRMSQGRCPECGTTT